MTAAIKVLWWRNGTLHQGEQALLEDYRRAPEGFLWIDILGEPNADERKLLVEEFRFDPTVVDAAHGDRHPPKLEVFGDAAFMMLRGFDDNATNINFKVVHIAAFFRQHVMVTRHRGRSPSVERIWQQLPSHPEILDEGGGPLALRLAQTVASRHLPIVLSLEDRLEEIEEEMFSNPRDGLLNELMIYRRQLKKLRRNANYSANAFQQVMDEPAPLFGDRPREIKDVRDRFERLATLCTLYSELASDLMNGYLSFASHRLNSVIKVLTVITAIFVPLTFLTSIYGMNFDNMPELHTEYGYFMMMGVMLTVASLLVFVFRRKGWV